MSELITYERILTTLESMNGSSRWGRLAKKLGIGRGELETVLRQHMPHPEIRLEKERVVLLPSSAIQLETQCGMEFRSRLLSRKEAKRFRSNDVRFSGLVFTNDRCLDKAIGNVETPFQGRVSNPHTRRALEEAFEAASSKNAVLVSDDGNFFIFSTGMFNIFRQPLFCLCQRQYGYPKPYKFVGLVSDGAGSFQALQVRSFSELPRQTPQVELSANFQEQFAFDGQEIVLSHDLSSIAVNFAHVTTRIERFPRTFWEDVYGRRFEPLLSDAGIETLSPKAVEEVKALLFMSDGRQQAYRAMAAVIEKALRDYLTGRNSLRWNYNINTQEGAFLLPLFKEGRNGAPVYLVIAAYATGRLHAKTVYDKSIVDFDCGVLFAA